jgi:hypothetical protein
MTQQEVIQFRTFVASLTSIRGHLHFQVICEGLDTPGAELYVGVFPDPYQIDPVTGNLVTFLSIGPTVTLDAARILMEETLANWKGPIPGWTSD